ncbi:rho GTPase-activating protein 7-like [Pteronotus mesoamericanus]|uniref:rho GTPase-activating protein 7-like n=1 Tax=Pteronotus mesoamericanus TaxID=1884717 RepID=UPI0023EDFE91|nr:rho GTPase-activating protein 7-like [Pteronotus parnellii mesoamericanus]XP_054422075.1 rho GTPase-activating protein 7-like [Pteronotus parnellii mesoamericanus]
MSAAIRKRSWEEHVTQWLGQPFSSDDHNTACHHGLVAESLQASMEKDATLNADRKEKCVSLPDCCHGSELRDFPGRPMGHISKEADENDSQEGEDPFLSLEASTETLVHVSDEDTDSDLYLTDDKHSLTSQVHETSDHHSVKGAGSLVKMLPITERNQDSYNSWGMASGADVALVGEREERKVIDIISKSLELCNDISLSEIKDASQIHVCDSLNVKDIVPEKQLLNSAVIAQQRRKPDFPKEEHESNTCCVVQDEFFTFPCTDRGLPLLKADTRSCLLQPPSCPGGMSAERGLQKSGFSEHQNKSLPKVNSGDGMPCLHLEEPLATQEPTDNQVRLRKRKEIKEDRDRARLDSMVLLIMKLDQLDQDIENALSASSSPSSTPTNLRRHVPDLESGSESGTETISVNQTSTHLSSNTESTDLPSSTPVANSGTKPKSTVSHK